MNNGTIGRSVSVTSMLFASISAIIGSGWLFSSYYAAGYAGPASVVSWMLGGLAIVAVAFVFGEICTFIPITGFSARAPQYTHGTIVGFIFAWIIWLSYAAMAAIEVQAVIQYLNYYFSGLVYGEHNALTRLGYVVATFLMIAVSMINVYSLRWLMRSNAFLTILKIIIPLFIAFVVLWIAGYFGIEKTIHPYGSEFMPLGLKGVFAAISSGGIVFAFNGFKQAAEMAGEAKNPRIALPIALIGSVVICMIIYIFLQITFIDSLKPHNIQNGWHNLSIASKASPLATILAQNTLEWLLPILYLCAIIAPLAAALMYCSSAARSLYGMSENNYVSSLFKKLNNAGNPVYAVVVNFAMGMLMFAPLPGWNNMAAFLSSLMTVTYAIGPITLLSLRQYAPNHKRVFSLPAARIWAIFAFYICTLLTYWCGWNIIYKLDIIILIGTIIFVTYTFYTNKKTKFNWHESTWMWIYFGGLSLISYFGSFGEGLGIITFGIDAVIIGIFSILVSLLSLKFILPPNEISGYLLKLEKA